MVLEGMVPVLMQTPPTTARASTTATRFLHLGSGHGGALPGWPGADDDQVVFDGAHVRVSIGARPCENQPQGRSISTVPADEERFVGRLYQDPRFCVKGRVNKDGHAGQR